MMLTAFRKLLRALRKRRFFYTPLIEVRIHKDAITHNLRAFFKGATPTSGGVAPVLKSNAYGHGLIEIARLLDAERLPFACVDSFFEALILRNEGVRMPLLILGYTPPENIKKSSLKNVAFGVIDLDELSVLARDIRNPRAIHLKIDTGMHRHGIPTERIGEAIALVKAAPYLRVEGVYTHLADADIPNSAHTRAQIAAWNMAVKTFRKKIPDIRYYHCAATAGSAYAKDIDANVMRLGLGLYGVNSGTNIDLAPVLEMRAKISSVRTLRAGESVGYNATFTASREMRTAMIPAGYYEGIDRRLSNAGTLLVRDIPCPIVGRVSMNITSVDVSSVPNVTIGDAVTIISADRNSLNSVENIARTCNTIPYEILVHIPAHLRRTIV